MKTIINHNLQFYLILLLFIFSVGCNKFLDKKSDNTLIVPSTLSDLQKLMDDSPLMNYEATPSLGETSADDFFIPMATLKNLQTGFRDQYFWRCKELSSINDWSVCYEKVYNSNLCLERLKAIKRNESNMQLWNNVKGSALFFRAYYFLQLAWNYAQAYDQYNADSDLGIALRMTSDFNVPSERATLRNTYAKIIEDANESLTLLPDISNVSTRPSKCAAYGLLARVYWSMRDYQNAFLYSDSSLRIKNMLIDFNDDEDIIAPLSKNVPFRKMNKEVVFYSEMNRQNGLHITTIQGRLDTLLYESYEDDDLRKLAYFSKNRDGNIQFKANYTGSIYALFSGIATDELYLIRAEANIRLGKISAGLTDLNTLMQKRWMTGSYSMALDISAEEALSMVLTERRKELLMRGLRWIDIKRLNKGEGNISLSRMENGHATVLEANAGYFALPLPEDIIRITGMPQNPL